ncbi:MAG TPA: zinc-ribbon domain-containing transport protein [Coriobacteriia bacterium]
MKPLRRTSPSRSRVKLDHALVRKVLAALAVAVLLAALLVPTVALARAGGGHVGGGSSGGSSGGGFSSSGSSGGIPFVGGSGGGCGGGIGTIVIIIIVLIVISKMKGGSGKSGGSGGGGGGAPMPPSMPSGDPYAEIKAADPNFNAEMFQGRVNEMFVAIQYAWMNRNMEPVRRFLSDQQFTVLNNSVQTDYIAKGQINKLDNVHITQMQPVEVVRQGDFDSVKMLITAACIDYTVDERTGQIVNPAELGDGKTPTTFQEYWTFMRKAGVASKMDATIQKCPNCGAPVTDGNYVKCAYCGVQLNDPTLDWVLMRIEQV